MTESHVYKTKLAIAVLLLSALCVLNPYRAFATQHITVMMPDSKVAGTIEIRSFNTIEYISLTRWAMLVDAALDWDYVTGVVEMRFRDHRIRWADRGRGAWINGRMQSMEGPAQQRDGDFWIPLSLLDVLVDPLWEGDLTWDRQQRMMRRLSGRRSAAGDTAAEPGQQQLVIVLDPGHGGDDTGCLHSSGLREKDIVLRLAGRLSDHLTNRLGARVVLTRPGDYPVPADDRVAVANRNRADLFVSLHIAPGSEMPGKSFVLYSLPETVPAPVTGDLVPWEYRSEDVVKRTGVYMHRFAEAAAVSASNANYGIQVMDLRDLKGLAMPGFVVELSWECSFYGELGLDREGGLNRASEALFDGIRNIYTEEN